ncbi:MAG: SprB repeat-containing protein [Lewinellaceae bacterium]|nr:SprB repeat-containing protein [Lewinellaceae bacterium]
MTSANGCVSTEAYIVAENVIIPSISGATIPNTSCISNNGSITLSVSPVLTYTYLWSGNQTSPDISNLPPGVYSVTVSGGGGCTASSSFTVDNDILAVTLDGTPANVLCFGDKTGSIDLNVNSGTQPFLYNWSPAVPGNPQDPSNLPAGNYTVTVTDAQGCTATIAFPVIQPASALQMSCVQSKNVSFPGAADGAGSVSLSGGEPPYDVVWSPGGTQSTCQATSRSSIWAWAATPFRPRMPTAAWRIAILPLNSSIVKRLWEPCLPINSPCAAAAA